LVDTGLGGVGSCAAAIHRADAHASQSSLNSAFTDREAFVALDA
jgi:hypothetical protein